MNSRDRSQTNAGQQPEPPPDGSAALGDAVARTLAEGDPGPGTTPPALRPSTALAIRATCLIHRFDTSRLTCLVCGLRIYVEVRIS